jgi:RNase H-fold protein (predicted Holliday junction resolvase)
MNYLGIDYGLKLTGLSLAAGPIAEPLATIPTSKIFALLPTLCSTHSVKNLIIGLPDGPIRSTVEAFSQQLSQMGFTCYLADETLSSQDALASLHHKSAPKRKLLEHSVSATIILQNWLDTQNNH